MRDFFKNPIIQKIVAGFVAGLFVAVIFYSWQTQKEEKIEQPKEKTLREKLLESTSAPPDATSQLKEEERQKLFESTSAPPNTKSKLSDEERQKLFETSSGAE